MPWLALNFPNDIAWPVKVDQCDMHRRIAGENCRRKSFDVTPALRVKVKVNVFSVF